MDLSRLLLCFEIVCLTCSSSQVEDVTHTQSTPQPNWQASTCAVDAQCQLSSFAQQPDIISSPVDGAAVFSSGKSVVLPLVADASASSVSLGEAAFPGDSSKQQQLSRAQQSMDMQQGSSSNQWSQQIIQVRLSISCLSHCCSAAV